MKFTRLAELVCCARRREQRSHAAQPGTSARARGIALTLLAVAALVAFTACRAHAQEGDDDGDDDPRANVNLGTSAAISVGPTARLSTIGWGTAYGAGYNFTRRHAVVGEFMWDKLYSEDHPALDPLRDALGTHAIDGSTNVFSITGNYRYELRGALFGAYLIVGGGWYNRYNKLSTRVTTVAAIPCTTAWRWWGFACASGTVVANQTLTSTALNTLGASAGVGFTVRVGDAPYRFYIEPRYHYAPTQVIPTQFITVTVGFRY